jgi:hypothetical protein
MLLPIMGDVLRKRRHGKRCSAYRAFLRAQPDNARDTPLKLKARELTEPA